MGNKVPVAEASPSQLKMLAIFPKFVSFISAFSSLYIVVDVLRLPRNKQKTYHRIMLGMSISDFISSSAWFFTTWPIPSEVLPVWAASGTQGTCSAQGFFAQTSVATVIYSGCLAFYYYLVILRGWSLNHLRESRVEWIMHGVSIGFALATSSISVGMGLMNPIGWDCWISSVPLGCQQSWLNHGETTCVRGDDAELFQWIFFYIPLWIIIFATTWIMLSIVWKFWIQEKRNEVHRRRAVGGDKKKSMALRSKRNKAKDLAIQSLLYVAAFYAAWTFPTIERISEVVSGTAWYHWVQLAAAFVPSQGLWNLVVYLRPRFQKIRARRQRLDCQNRGTSLAFSAPGTSSFKPGSSSFQPGSSPRPRNQRLNNFDSDDIGEAASVPLEHDTPNKEVGTSNVAMEVIELSSVEEVSESHHNMDVITRAVSNNSIRGVVGGEEQLNQSAMRPGQLKRGISAFRSVSRIIPDFIRDIQTALISGDAGAGAEGVGPHSRISTVMEQSVVEAHPECYNSSNESSVVNDDEDVPVTTSGEQNEANSYGAATAVYVIPDEEAP